MMNTAWTAVGMALRRNPSGSGGKVRNDPHLFYFWRAAYDPAGTFFHYTTAPAICQEKNMIKMYKLFLPILCILPSWLSRWCVVYYWCQGEGATQLRESGLGWTNCWIPPLFAWGVNVYAIFLCQKPTFLKIISRNPLTNRSRCGTIKAQKEF